jgi:hypothetical protein
MTITKKKKIRIQPGNKKMKLRLNLFLFLLVFFSFSSESFSLTDYQIKQYCKKEKRVYSCIKDLQEKKSNLQKGKFIEIPVVPYRR